VLTLTSGTVIGQAVSVIASPIATRLYSPFDMGTLASCLAISSIIGVAAAGRYDVAIVLPEEEEDATALVFLGGAIALCLGIVIIFVFLIGGDRLVHLLKLQNVPRVWHYSIGFIVMLTGWDHILHQLNIRQRTFTVLASTQVTQQVSANAVKIGAGILKCGVNGLFVSAITGYVVRLSRLLWKEKKRFLCYRAMPSYDRKRIKRVAARYKNFPLFGIWSGLLNSASTNIPVILFSSLFSAEVSGYYSLSNSVLHLPMSFIGTSVGNVFLERAARERDNPAELKRIVLELCKKLLLIGSVSMSFVTFYGDVLFPFVFGSQWKEAGVYAQWISIWIVFQLAVSPLSPIYSILEKQREWLLWQCLLFFPRISVLFLFLIIKNILDVFKIYALCSAFFYFLLSLRVLIMTKNTIKDITLCMLKNCVSIYLVQYLVYIVLRGCNIVP